MVIIGMVPRFLFCFWFWFWFFVLFCFVLFCFPELALAKEAILFGFYFGYFFFLPQSIIPI